MFFDVSDSRSGNILASFKDQDEALECIAVLVRRNPEEADQLVLTAVDDDGHAVESWLASELMPPRGAGKLRIPEFH
jgi:hypothetical protein